MFSYVVSTAKGSSHQREKIMTGGNIAHTGRNVYKKLLMLSEIPLQRFI